MSSTDGVGGAGDTAQRSGAQSNTPYHLQHDYTAHDTTPVPAEIGLIPKGVLNLHPHTRPSDIFGVLTGTVIADKNLYAYYSVAFNRWVVLDWSGCE